MGRGNASSLPAPGLLAAGGRAAAGQRCAPRDPVSPRLLTEIGNSLKKLCLCLHYAVLAHCVFIRKSDPARLNITYIGLNYIIGGAGGSAFY